MNKALVWDPDNTPAPLQPMMRELGGYYPIRQGPAEGTALGFQQDEGVGRCRVTLAGGTATIGYSTPPQAARAVGALLAGIVSEASPCEELRQCVDEYLDGTIGQIAEWESTT